jgi:neutral trehalase
MPNLSLTYRGQSVQSFKYDVEEIGPNSEGGEYRVQDGSGWTNEVLLSFLNGLRL